MLALIQEDHHAVELYHHAFELQGAAAGPSSFRPVPNTHRQSGRASR